MKWRQSQIQILLEDINQTTGCHEQGVYLLHQVHDAFKRVFFISRVPLLLLKEPTDLPHDFGLLVIALVVLWTEAWLVGLQPLRVLEG